MSLQTLLGQFCPMPRVKGLKKKKLENIFSLIFSVWLFFAAQFFPLLFFVLRSFNFVNIPALYAPLTDKVQLESVNKTQNFIPNVVAESYYVFKTTFLYIKKLAIVF